MFDFVNLPKVISIYFSCLSDFLPPVKRSIYFSCFVHSFLLYGNFDNVCQGRLEFFNFVELGQLFLLLLQAFKGVSCFFHVNFKNFISVDKFSVVDLGLVSLDNLIIPFFL
jgi:hypothetical protein